MHRYIYISLCFVLFSTLAAAEPKIQNPVFQPLSTKNGLPQDVVNDIVVDNEGFVWIATDGGLVRWDGVETKEIDNSDNLFSNSYISRLTIQEGEALFVSVYGKGIYRVDLDTQAIEQLTPTPYKYYQDYIQFADAFHWQDSTHLIITLSLIHI